MPGNAIICEFTSDELNAIWVSVSARCDYLKEGGDPYGRLPRYEATLKKIKNLMDEVEV